MKFFGGKDKEGKTVLDHAEDLSNTEATNKAILDGIDEGRSELPSVITKKEKSELEEKKRLSQSYNAASGLYRALTDLQNIPGSKFEFNVENGSGMVFIKTNIPLTTSSRNLTIYVDGNNISARADYDLFGAYPQYVEAKADKPEKIIKHVAKKATLNGLIPS